MNNVNLNTIRVGASPLGVGDEVVVQQSPESKAIVTGPGVTVSTAFDSLVDWLARDAEKVLDKQASNRLALAISSIAARAGISSEVQRKTLDKCEQLTNQIAEDKDQLSKEEAERARLEEEIAKYKEQQATAPAGGTGGKQGVPEGPTLEELEKQLADCNGRIAALETRITGNTKELNVALGNLDDKSARVFAAAVRVSSSKTSAYLDVLRNLGEDEGADGSLSAIDAFNRLLAGEDIEKVLLEELGIRG